MNLRSKLLLAFGCLTLVGGCESNTITPVAAEPDIVTVKLAQAADKASQALDNIAGVEQARGPAIPVEDYANAPANLMQPITVKWSGPIESITKVLAERAGMRFRTKGSIPAVPLTMHVDVYQQPILHVLRDIGLQAGHRADLAVDAKNGVVELRYAPGDENTPMPVREIPHASEEK